MPNNYQPDHQNQHSDYPVPLPGWYVSQRWPYYDCWVRVTSWMADGATGGEFKPSPIDVRLAADKPPRFRIKGAQPEPFYGPGGGEDVAKAMQHFKLDYNWDIKEAAHARALITTPANRYIWVATDFSKWPDGHRCDPGFRGRHAIGVIPGVTENGKVKVMDPVCNSYYWVTVDHIMESALYYAGHDHGHWGHVYIGYVDGKNGDGCPPGKIRNNAGDCVDPPGPNPDDPEPWYNNQANIDTAGAAIGGSTAITIVLIIITVVIIGGIYVAVKSGNGVEKVVDRGEPT